MDKNPYRAPQAESPQTSVPRSMDTPSKRRTVNWFEVLVIIAIIGALVAVLLPPTQSGARIPRPQTADDVM